MKEKATAPESEDAALREGLPTRLVEPWRQRTHGRLAAIEGLVQVLMKPRNGEPWTDADRAFLWRELRETRTTRLFYLFRIPGSQLFVPALSWLLDRRRGDRAGRPGGHRKQDFIGGAVG